MKYLVKVVIYLYTYDFLIISFYYFKAVIKPSLEWSDSDNEEEQLFPPIEDLTFTSGTEADFIECSTSTPVKKRGRKNFITSRLVAALDFAKVSDGMAAHILIAAAEAFGLHLEELVINRSSIHRIRQEYRLRESKEILNSFSDNVIKF